MTIYYRGFKNLAIDGDDFVAPGTVRRFIRRAPYEASIVEQLNKVWGTWTGWAVLRGILDSAKTLTIVPFTREDEKGRPDAGAYVRPTWWLRALNGAPKEAQVFLGGEDDPSTPKDERYRVVPILRGTGRGTDAEMHYTPGNFREPVNSAVPVCPQDGTAARDPCRVVTSAELGPDGVLVHELVHALRYMRGQMNNVPTLDKGYDNEEEYFAILVANIYISEKGRTSLVANHHSYRALGAKLSTSETFLGKGSSPPSRDQLENRRLVHKFVCQNHGLCAHLSGRVTAAFNPIREFMRNAQLYPLSPGSPRE